MILLTKNFIKSALQYELLQKSIVMLEKVSVYCKEEKTIVNL